MRCEARTRKGVNISGFIFVRRSGERKNTSKTEGIFTKTQDEDLGRFRTAFQDPVYEMYIYNNFSKNKVLQAPKFHRQY